MRARLLPVLVVLGAATALAGDGPPPTDPFLAALAGRSGPDAVAAPSFDPDLEAVSWSLRPRREIVDGLAARLLRGEAKGWTEPAKEFPALPAPPSRIPADFDPGKVEVSDRLTAWVPGDAAAVLFGSLKEAGEAVEGLAKFLPDAFPRLCGDSLVGRRDALRRAVDQLLLPVIWNSNPGARTGTRQVALVVSDPDVRWAPDIALLCEVDDATLVRSHRQATFSWEGRRPIGLRVDGLDAVSDDGSVRSYFALEGGIALWSTTKSLRERILAAGSAKVVSLLRPDARAYAFARKAFPASEGGALLVVPDAFLARINAADLRARSAAALRCEATRLLLDAHSIAGSVSKMDTVGLSCPAGRTLSPRADDAGASCPIHGTPAFTTPLGDLPEVPVSRADAERLPVLVNSPDPILEGAVPVAMRWLGEPVEVVVPPTAPSHATVIKLLEGSMPGFTIGPWFTRRSALTELRPSGQGVESTLERLMGLGPIGSRTATKPQFIEPGEPSRRYFRITEPR